MRERQKEDTKTVERNHNSGRKQNQGKATRIRVKDYYKIKQGAQGKTQYHDK